MAKVSQLEQVCSILGRFCLLKDEQLGKLVKTIIQYNTDKKQPTIDDPVVLNAFKIIKQESDKIQKLSEIRTKSIGKRWGKTKECILTNDFVNTNVNTNEYTKVCTNVNTNEREKKKQEKERTKEKEIIKKEKVYTPAILDNINLVNISSKKEYKEKSCIPDSAGYVQLSVGDVVSIAVPQNGESLTPVSSKIESVVQDKLSVEDQANIRTDSISNRSDNLTIQKDKESLSTDEQNQSTEVNLQTNNTLLKTSEAQKSENQQHKQDTIKQLRDKALECFEKTWQTYPRKVNKEQAKKTWVKKFATLKSEDEVLTKARQIFVLVSRYIKSWEDENGEKGRDKQFIPHFSSWLNANIPDTEG